jgi:hypothetical protein
VNFVSNSHGIEEGTPIFAEWANRPGRTDQTLTNDQLCEFSHWDNVA